MAIKARHKPCVDGLAGNAENKNVLLEAGPFRRLAVVARRAVCRIGGLCVAGGRRLVLLENIALARHHILGRLGGCCSVPVV